MKISLTYWNLLKNKVALRSYKNYMEVSPFLLKWCQNCESDNGQLGKVTRHPKAILLLTMNHWQILEANVDLLLTDPNQNNC